MKYSHGVKASYFVRKRIRFIPPWRFLLLVTLFACTTQPTLLEASVEPQPQRTTSSTFTLTSPSYPLPSTQPNPTQTHPILTAPNAGLTPTPWQATSTATPIIIETLPAFTTSILRSGVLPQSYITDTCKYLRLRWTPTNSLPGTVVVPIFFHAIRPTGEELYDPSFISADQFQAIINRAVQLGFKTITTAQLLDFLTKNARIPSRSMLLILDDRRPGTLEEYFIPVAEKYNWTITLGWIIADTRPSLWTRMENLAATGYLDVQSHGYWHYYITETTPEETIREELFNPIPVLEAHFGTRPIAIIWPGGNFTQLAVRIAREAEYELGFSTHSRGPLMFNWIPLGEAERNIQDSLMVLPRFWSTSAILNLEQAANINQTAYSFALSNYQNEASWYRTYCGGELPIQSSEIHEFK
ncbi:MAG: polysaccharide deacetylase family protein [Chloroflexota bacterium]